MGEKYNQPQHSKEDERIIELAIQATHIWEENIVTNRERTLDKISPLLFAIHQVLFQKGGDINDN